MCGNELQVSHAEPANQNKQTHFQEGLREMWNFLMPRVSSEVANQFIALCKKLKVLLQPSASLQLQPVLLEQVTPSSGTFQQQIDAGS